VDIKINNVVVSSRHENGVSKVIVRLSIESAFELPTPASLRLSPREARELAARFLDAASKAEELMVKP
jgi:hypothetical protein